MMYFNRFGDTTVRKIQGHGTEILRGIGSVMLQDTVTHGFQLRNLILCLQRDSAVTYDSFLQFRS